MSLLCLEESLLNRLVKIIHRRGRDRAENFQALGGGMDAVIEDGEFAGREDQRIRQLSVSITGSSPIHNSQFTDSHPSLKEQGC